MTLREFIAFLDEQSEENKDRDVSYIDVSYPMDDISITIVYRWK